ncbi:MAG TPA: peroxidase-related enzyme [Burkholderiales bacterium]|nr:peroxidase-related enzyme [Burkholderiales bacterium]
MKRPWINIAPPEEAVGDLKRAYERIRSTRGRIPEIRSVMAGEPLVVEGFAAFFPENNYACSSIERRLAEMIATVASVANGSGFGAPAHARQLARITDDQSFADNIMRDYRTVELSTKERVLLDYVWKLSKTPGEMTQKDIDGLRAQGWTDPQIVATVHVTSLFAYMNRVAEAFGLEHSTSA